MDDKKVTIEDDFLNTISEYMKDSKELDVKQIYKLFPDINKKTISWRLYDLKRQGKIYRTGHGYYSMSEIVKHTAAGYEYLQKKSREVYDIVSEYGYEFYISGLDALVGEVLHIPEQYPTILIVEEAGIHEIKEALNSKNFFVISEKEKKLFFNDFIKNKVDVIIFKGKDFSLAYEAIADKEKGFIDLYYAITRFEYATSIPELSRIYESMERNKSINTIKMKKSAKDRGITTEINWLLELSKASKKTIEFMAYQTRGIQ